MKKYTFLSALLLIVSSVCYSQFDRNNIELSLLGTAGVEKLYGSQSTTYAFVTGSFGYFILDNISLEPQFGILVDESGPPSKSAILNISYTKRISNSSIGLFARGGYGISNSISIPLHLGMMPARIVDNWDVKILNFGVGLKFLASESIALRVETNYREESFTKEVYPFYPYYQPILISKDFKYSNFTILFGFSFLLNSNY